MVSMTDKQYGILGTVIIHSVLILLLLFSFMSLPKPAPPEGGLLINFGDVISAGGPAEPALNNTGLRKGCRFAKNARKEKD
jgi:hypothetical protein